MFVLAVRALIIGAIWKDEVERPKWTARLFYAIVAVVVILLLMRLHEPGIRNEFPTLSMMDTVVNVTDSNDNATDDSKTGSEKSVFADDLDEETDLKEESDFILFVNSLCGERADFTSLWAISLACPPYPFQ
uniref:Uncharacterized protein n=1 Tax=Solanum lycopersicum TaxID=4081 RepID=A0A3Q7E933_SOLLC